MRRWISLLGTAALLARALPLAAQDPAAVWKALSQGALDPQKSAAVRSATVVRDRIKITLAEGTVQLAAAIEGRVPGAAFAGRGRVELAPPNRIEGHQLRLFTGKESLETDFSEAVFFFSDPTAQELGAQAQWAPAASTQLARTYRDRMQEGENHGAELLPRLVKGLLSADPKRTALFAADLKTADKGWIQVRFDGLEPEEITAGRWADWGKVRAFDTWLSFPAASRSPMEAFRDPLAREDFRIRGYRIDAAVTSGAELRATTRVSLDYAASGERVLLFQLDANLRVESVKDQQGASLVFFQPRDPGDRAQSYGDYVAVALPEPTRAGQRQTLEFRYGGKRVIQKVGAGNYFCQSYGWYPTRPNSFAARADFEMHFRCPRELVATGVKTGETTAGNLTVTSWKSEIPLSVAGFAFGDYKVHNDKAGSIDVEIYANRQADDMLRAVERGVDAPGQPSSLGRAPLGSLSPAALAKTMGAEIANTLRLFEMYFGPYPYKRLAVTNIPYSYGQGWPGLLYLSAISFLDSTQRQGLGISAHTELTDFFRAHEASHQWWGHRVGWKSYHDQWISEGFAQFSGNLYVLYRQNENEFLNRLRQDKQELLARDERSRVFESLGPVWMGHRLSSADSPRGYATVVYNKGGLVLHMLRSMMLDPRSKPVDARFMAMMREFCQTFHNQPASTEDFKAVAEKHMLPSMDLDANSRLDWFFQQYVYGTGVPHYQFRYKVQEAANGQWKVSATITPKAVPPGWKDSLRLYMHAKGGPRHLGWLVASDKESSVEFPLPAKPEKLSLNNGEETLARIEQ